MIFNFLYLVCQLTLFSIVRGAPMTPNAGPETEKWHIPDMKLHFMGPSTQTPIPWNTQSSFDSTFEFNIVFPDGKTTCTTHWPQGSPPTREISCNREASDQIFSLSPRENRNGTLNECNFVLHVRRLATHGRFYSASHAIGCNDPQVESSYLTCLSGAPFDGIRCELKGPMSVMGDLVLEARCEGC
ncbi:hypothetical protein BCR34DRAFT_15867 [Clohesyomyces aquaticus]|uniref:AA1-like domain-containing protein n=1 Tax=Clohesyomyces aquaticus TaxID=1231657 RepID=A0A1Y1ZCL5_9PLEO|nr:hypothetical protein BCR34DRAFT_15867 [Clohesyomyces aquaticus]